MSLDLLSCMKGFKAVAEHKGFSQAARHSHMSTSTLTSQVQYLEGFLKKKLFNRTTRQIALTEAGEIYLARVNKILAEIEESTDAVHAIETQPHGKLTLGISATFYSRFFIRKFQEFLQKYPTMQLDTTDENSPIDLLNGVADLVVTEIDIKDNQFVKEHLYTMRRNIYAAPKYIKKFGVPKTISDLKQHNCLIAKRISPHNEWILSKNKKAYVTGNYASTSGFNILYAALNGVGLMWCSDIMIQEEIRRGEVIKVELEDEQPVAIQIYMYHRHVSYDSNIRLMADYLKKISKSYS